MATHTETKVASCPPYPNEIAEQYVLGRLPPAETAAFERHLQTCPQCREAILDFKDFLAILKQED